MPKIVSIYRYPVKGLSAEPLTDVELRADEGLPLDRAYALARPDAPFDAARPVWLRKTHFLMLMTDERLAELQVRYGDDCGRLTIEHGGAQRLEADLRTPQGRAAIERFFKAFMGDGLAGRPRLVSAAGHSFTDNANKRVSLINLSTVQEIEGWLGQPVDPLRFRGNLYLTGLPAWAELDWVGRELACGDVRFEASERIDRCAATNVDPATGLRDLNIPLALRRHYGHIDCGLLLRVVRGGTIHAAQAIDLN
jgi:uncharacterized protein YcbX